MTLHTASNAHPHPSSPRLSAPVSHPGPRWAVPLLLCALALPACGGGGSGSGDDAAATPGIPTSPATPLVYAKGTVDGLGAVLVNGVRYDMASARVLDEEGQASSPEALKLGMVVEIVASAPQAGSNGVTTSQAQEVRYASEIEGPITALNDSEMVVLGQAVRYDPTTWFEEGRAATLRLGTVVEVHGQRNPQGVVLASRIDVEDDRDEPYKLVAPISNHDPVARSFTAGSASISYAALPQSSVDNGQWLRMRLLPEQQANGQWLALALTPLQNTAWGDGNNTGSTANGVAADIEGYVTQMDGARRFVVSGVTVDASQARKFPASLAVGSLVDVEGRLVNGVLLADEVELERRLDSTNGLEIEGRITALDWAASRFEVRGITVYFGQSRFIDGTAQQLAVGMEVEVRGTLSADGMSILASVVELD